MCGEESEDKFDMTEYIDLPILRKTIKDHEAGTQNLDPMCWCKSAWRVTAKEDGRSGVTTLFNQGVASRRSEPFVQCSVRGRSHFEAQRGHFPKHRIPSGIYR
jgi:hypothetical protein